jgi:proteasome activator-like protein
MSDDVEVVTNQEQGDQPRATIEEPGKLLRIAVMLREMQEEVRRAPTDEAGRERLRTVYDRAVSQLVDALSGDLREELTTLNLPLTDGVPSESEILIAQAQLIGWLEGLFQGIQAAIASQQIQARQQLEQMRQRGLPGGRIMPGLPQEPGQPQGGTGQYL